jgi:hypothetical protein
VNIPATRRVTTWFSPGLSRYEVLSAPLCNDFGVTLANKLVSIVFFQLIWTSDTLKTILDSKVVKLSELYDVNIILFHDDAIASLQIYTLFAWLISHQPTVLFSQNKPATSNQPTLILSQNKPTPAKRTCCNSGAVVFVTGTRTLGRLKDQSNNIPIQVERRGRRFC